MLEERNRKDAETFIRASTLGGKNLYGPVTNVE